MLLANILVNKLDLEYYISSMMKVTRSNTTTMRKVCKLFHVISCSYLRSLALVFPVEVNELPAKGGLDSIVRTSSAE